MKNGCLKFIVAITLRIRFKTSSAEVPLECITRLHVMPINVASLHG